MKSIISTFALLFTLAVNAQIVDTVKIMQIHTTDGVTSFEIDNIDFIDFYYKINTTTSLNELVYIDTKADKLDYKRELTQEEVVKSISVLPVSK